MQLFQLYTLIQKIKIIINCVFHRHYIKFWVWNLRNSYIHIFVKKKLKLKFSIVALRNTHSIYSIICVQFAKMLYGQESLLLTGFPPGNFRTGTSFYTCIKCFRPSFLYICKCVQSRTDRCPETYFLFNFNKLNQLYSHSRDIRKLLIKKKKKKLTNIFATGV